MSEHPVKQAAAMADLMGPMRAYRKDAFILQQAGIIGEQQQIQQGVEYSDAEVRMAIVHTRQDIVTMVSHLDTIAECLIAIRRSIYIAMLIGIIYVAVAFGLPYAKARGWW